MIWASRHSLASFPLPALFCLSLAAGCEHDAPPTREPPKAPPAAAPAAASPVAQNAPPGLCADEPGKPHCGCGAMCSGKCGDGCGNGPPAAGCDDPAKPPPTTQPAGCGCGSKGAAAPPPSGPIIENGRAQIGDRTMCPVMSSPFVIKSDSPKTEYQGKTYFFCCEGCVDQFKKKPESFI